MRIILKSLLYTAYYIPVALKNYVPIFLYLVFSQFLVMYTQSIYLVLFFFTGYLIISSPLVINIFRNIILNNNIENNYFDFFKKEYTKIFLNRIFYLLFSIIIQRADALSRCAAFILTRTQNSPNAFPPIPRTIRGHVHAWKRRPWPPAASHAFPLSELSCLDKKGILKKLAS